tara:strand:- start:3219 stop:3545 length:327 start_codon:yes stop_codon:yes gene_type:complete
MFSKNKYNAKRFLGYDSKKESRRATELKILEKSGLISDLKEQVPYELLEPFTYEGKKIKGIKYIADFQYIENGQLIVEDVKGFKTQSYKLKKKLLLYKYGNKIIFKET